MWRYVFASLFVAVLAVEVKENFEETDSDHSTDVYVNASLSRPVEEHPEIEVKQMSRITEPINYHPDISLSNLSNNSLNNTILNATKDETFNPSPEIPETFEHNKYPVVPAYPESKHIYSATISPNNLRTYLPPAPVSVLHSFYETTTPNTYLPPRKFYVENSNRPQKNQYNQYLPPKSSSQPPLPDTKHKLKDQPYPYYFNANSNSNNEKGYNIQPYHHEGSDIEHNKHKEIFPWKKMIHFITALLPIGLLLTALTPTILTVTPVRTNNDTFKLSRGVEVDPSLLELLEGRPEDVTGCHQTKLICNAASRGRYPGASNLQKSLWLIASQAYDEQSGPKEILKLFNAIKENKCNDSLCGKN